VRFVSRMSEIEEKHGFCTIKKATYPWWLLLEELLWLAATMSITLCIGSSF
jgi:hypothetical protein